jgi:hypothetical protein
MTALTSTSPVSYIRFPGFDQYSYRPLPADTVIDRRDFLVETGVSTDGLNWKTEPLSSTEDREEAEAIADGFNLSEPVETFPVRWLRSASVFVEETYWSEAKQKFVYRRVKLYRNIVRFEPVN